MLKRYRKKATVKVKRKKSEEEDGGDIEVALLEVKGPEAVSRSGRRGHRAGLTDRCGCVAGEEGRGKARKSQSYIPCWLHAVSNPKTSNGEVRGC
jgi:hypothetical protein